MARRKIAEMVETKPVYLTVKGLNEYLGGVGSREVQRGWRETKQLPFYVVANKILYRISDVDKFVAKHRVAALKRENN